MRSLHFSPFSRAWLVVQGVNRESVRASAPMETRQISSQLVYENRWMRVREDQVRRPDGSQGIFGVVEKDDFAPIIPVDIGGDLWVVEQFRYPVRGRFVEFPQGSWEDRSGTDPETLARAELAEETGLVAASLDHVGHLYEAYGYCNQGFDVWIASDLERGDPRRSVEEQGMEVRRVTRAEWRVLLAGGQVKDAPSVAAYGLLMLYEAGELDAG
jgi:ADP-ribose pyrophosphatase